MDVILWSFALHLLVLIWVDFNKTYLLQKSELPQQAAGASSDINKTISSKRSTVQACFNFLGRWFPGVWDGRQVLEVCVHVVSQRLVFAVRHPFCKLGVGV